MIGSTFRTTPVHAAHVVRGNIGATPNPNSLTLPAHSLMSLLAQPGASGIRAHFGVNDGVTTLVYTAVDQNGKDILDQDNPVIIDGGIPCPPFCGEDQNPVVFETLV